jgi:hypothetical protein
MMWILLVLLVIILLWGTKEGFVEMFGFSGYSKPIDVDINIPPPDLSAFNLSGDAVTPDEVEKVLLPAQKFMKDKTGLCVYAIETNKIEKYVREKQIIYKFRVMFTVTNKGFPYGIGATFYIMDGKVVSAMTQQVGGQSEVQPYVSDYGEFLSFDEIVSKQRKVILKQ